MGAGLQPRTFARVGSDPVLGSELPHWSLLPCQFYLYQPLTDTSLLGLLTATVASRIHRAAQPALLYLVPFTLLPLLTMAYLKVSACTREAGLCPWCDLAVAFE